MTRIEHVERAFGAAMSAFQNFEHLAREAERVLRLGRRSAQARARSVFDVATLTKLDHRTKQVVFYRAAIGRACIAMKGRGMTRKEMRAVFGISDQVLSDLIDEATEK